MQVPIKIKYALKVYRNKKLLNTWAKNKNDLADRRKKNLMEFLKIKNIILEIKNLTGAKIELINQMIDLKQQGETKRRYERQIRRHLKIISSHEIIL